MTADQFNLFGLGLVVGTLIVGPFVGFVLAMALVHFFPARTSPAV